MRRLPDGLILLSGGREQARNADNNLVFRQDSDFLYLTGVEEPDFILLIDPRRRVSTLFAPRIDSTHKVWLGYVPGPAECRKLFDIERVAYADELPKYLKRAKSGYRKLYCDKLSLKKFRKELRGLSPRPSGLREALAELRAVKTPGEIELLKEAGKITSRAHRAAMAGARAGMREYEVQAIFESECLSGGLRHLAFPSIVASGTNSAVLHYHKNDAVLKNGDLLLLDAGGELRGYAADITRTFPVSGRFSRRQRDIYSIVLDAHKACIEQVRPGVASTDLHLLTMTRIAEGLKSLGLLKGDVSGLVESGVVRLFYPHGFGHMLGIDVHDVGGGRKRLIENPAKVPVRFLARLEPGFVVTVEPGIYFIEALLRDPVLRAKHRGSVVFSKAESFLDFGGVRIEDDLLVRPAGPALDLTEVPKEIDEVERMRGA